MAKATGQVAVGGKKRRKKKKKGGELMSTAEEGILDTGASGMDTMGSMMETYKEEDLEIDPTAEGVGLYNDGDDQQGAKALYARMWNRKPGSAEGEGEPGGRAGSPMGRRLRSRDGEDGGDELDSEDADSSSDEDEAVFASMGSTGQIVPLNRDMIRAEAEMAMEGKVHALLDDKLKLFDDQKNQLLDLQKVRSLCGLGAPLPPR